MTNEAMTTDMKIAEVPTDPLDDFIIGDAYETWQKREGVRVIRDFAFDNLCDIELTPWPRKGGAGAIINIPNDYLPSDAHLVEIAPGGQSEPERHVYEENVCILSGHGATKVWLDGQEPDIFEWEAGSLFSIPLNAWYQHFNGSKEAARYIAVTDAPTMMRRMRDYNFIFNNPFQFNRYKPGQNQFTGGKLYNRRVWETNFVPNARDMALYGWKQRGAGGINVMLELAQNSLKAHISEFPVGTYKKGHRHGPGAHLLILNGVGFSLLWTAEDMSDIRRCDWKAGGMVIVPSDNCYHQHFNTGTTCARYLALRPGSGGFYPPQGGRGRLADVSIKEGGIQIEYSDESRKIHEIFEAELARHGATCRMKAFVPWCNGVVGPTSERDT